VADRHMQNFTLQKSYGRILKKADFKKAIMEFETRERKFGG